MVLGGGLLLIEVVCRIFLGIVFTDFGLDRHGLYDRFYPCLDAPPPTVDDRTGLLVLGGSAVSPLPLVSGWHGAPDTSIFCGHPSFWDTTRFRLHVLARPGLNSMDSRVLLDRFDLSAFSHVLIYHGINDVRTNNVSLGAFDSQYRHIEFYDDLAVLRAHPEHRIWSTPFVLHWLVHSVRTRDRAYIPKEVFWGLLDGRPEDFIASGDSIRSDAVFEENLRWMVGHILANGSTPVLATYAYHLPPDYTLDAFRSGALDYGRALFETELYGAPENVRKGLVRHEHVVRRVASSMDVVFVDLATLIPRDGRSFDDVCHLTPAGCRSLSGAVQQAILAHADD